MAHAIEAVIGTQHGETCTCRRLDPITVTAQPVIASRGCRGQREIPRADEIAGRVAIVWPAAGNGPLLPFDMAVLDADSGELLTDVLAVRLVVNSRAAITVDLERAVDADGRPIGTGETVPDEDGKGVRTAVLRYTVAEMRIAEPA